MKRTQISDIVMKKFTSTQLSLGGRDPAEDSTCTLRDSRYQGCISRVTVNGLDIMRLSLTESNVINNNADTTQCVTDLSPPDPCSENSCLNDGVCDVNLDDYSGKD